MNAPCYKCEDRSAARHGRRAKYKEWADSRCPQRERGEVMIRLTDKDWKNPESLMWIKLGLIQMRDEGYRSSLSYALRKLAHYEDLEEQGRLIELPCAVGDTVYLFSYDDIHPLIINSFEINKYEVEFKASYCGEEKNLVYWAVRLPVSKIGKTVFLTPEEAEAKLKEKGGAE